MTEKIALCTAGGAIASFHAAFKRMLEVLEAKAPGRFELVGAFGGLSGLAKGSFVPIPSCPNIYLRITCCKTVCCGILLGLRMDCFGETDR